MPSSRTLFVLVTIAVIVLFLADDVLGRKAKKKPRPAHERYETLDEYVGHMCDVVCAATAKKHTNKASTYRGRIELGAQCDMFCERLRHMIVVSGNDALIQLQKEEMRQHRHHQGSRNYYKLAIERASSGKHLELLKKIIRTNSDWVLQGGARITKEAVSEELQPHIGQWLLNVASGADPAVTNADLARDDPEPIYPGEDDDDDEL